MTRQFLPHASTASDGLSNARITYNLIIESLGRVAVSLTPVLSVKHGTAASTERTLCSTVQLLIFSHEPVQRFSDLIPFRVDKGKTPSAPSNGDMVSQLKAWRLYRVCLYKLTCWCNHMYDGSCFMLSRVYHGGLHSGRQRAPTETPQCWSDPTTPRQPDTTGSLRAS